MKRNSSVARECLIRSSVVSIIILLACLAVPVPGLTASAGAEQKLVLAFYYPWYRTIEDSGYCTWNFGGLQYEDRDKRCAENKNTPRLPAGGLYDSLNPEVVRRHLDESRRAGIDGWVVSWWGRGDQTDAALALVLDEAGEHAPGFKIAVYYEMIPGCRGWTCDEMKGPEKVKAALDDFRWLHSRYFSHPSYLRADGRPVVFVYIRAMLHGMGEWPQIIAQLRPEMELFLSADAATTFLDPLVPKVFDQVHFYNQVYELKILAPWLVDYRGFVQRARCSGRSAAVTVIPGYDERLVPGRPGVRLERKDGKTYEQIWEKALAAEPDWVLITSFNEWYEGSEIEPSQELGETYLDLTASYAARFKGDASP